MSENNISKGKLIFNGITLCLLILIVAITLPIMSGNKNLPNFLLEDCDENPRLVQTCIAHNIDNYNCVRQGYTEQNWLGFTNFDNEYYNCEELGTVIRSCIEWSRGSPSNLTADYKYCKEGTG